MEKNYNKIVAEAAIERYNERATPREVEAAKRLTAALEGDLKSRHWLQEGIATSDIPTLLTPAINVRFLEAYAAVPTVWTQLAREYFADDFGNIEFGDFVTDASHLAGVHGGETFVNGGLPRVGEYDEYPAVRYAVEQISATLHKAGVRARLSWEAMLKTGNFDLITRFIESFSQWAANSEDITLARQFAGVGGGVNTDNWTSSNQVTGNPALTLSGLEAAKAQARLATVNGNPVNAPRFKLVTAPGLSETAKNLLSITSIERTDANGTYTQNASTVTGDITHVELSWIAAAELGGAAINDYWWLVPDGTPRPAFLEVFLRDNRSPLISIKDSGHFRVGGGGVPERQGSFDVDDIQTRVRHVVEAAPLELAGAVWSDGSES